VEPTAQQIVEDLPPDGILLSGGANDGDGFGTEDGVEGVHGESYIEYRVLNIEY